MIRQASIAARRYVVLLVDDEPQVRQTATAILHQHDIEVLEACDLESVTAVATSRHIDLALIDFNLGASTRLDVV